MKKKVAVAIALGLSRAMACAPAQSPAVSVSAALPASLPAKCTSCHIAPKPRTLPEARWPVFLKAHQRRLRISDADKGFLHGYLVGAAPASRP